MYTYLVCINQLLYYKGSALLLANYVAIVLRVTQASGEGRFELGA
jgi:hypothetical protein